MQNKIECNDTTFVTFKNPVPFSVISVRSVVKKTMSDEHPLDGKYLITSTSSHQGDIEKRSDGETEIRNSQTERFDEANCKWTSTFEIISDTEVKMTSVADPSEAAVDFLLTAPDGSPTRESVTYETTLKLARKGDKIQMSGQIEYGADVIFLTMRKVGD